MNTTNQTAKALLLIQSPIQSLKRLERLGAGRRMSVSAPLALRALRVAAICAAACTTSFAALANVSGNEPQAGPGESAGSMPAVEVRIDEQKITHTMQSGGGASWHAMGPENIVYEGLIGRPNQRARGSGWGGNPPLSYSEPVD